MDSLWPVGFLPGLALSSVIRYSLGFIYNFAFGMLAALLAMLYAILVVKDSRDAIQWTFLSAKNLALNLAQFNAQA